MKRELPSRICIMMYRYRGSWEFSLWMNDGCGSHCPFGELAPSWARWVYAVVWKGEQPVIVCKRKLKPDLKLTPEKEKSIGVWWLKENCAIEEARALHATP